MTPMQTLQALYDSEINFHISTFWDEGFKGRVKPLPVQDL